MKLKDFCQFRNLNYKSSGRFLLKPPQWRMPVLTMLLNNGIVNPTYKAVIVFSPLYGEIKFSQNPTVHLIIQCALFIDQY